MFCFPPPNADLSLILNLGDCILEDVKLKDDFDLSDDVSKSVTLEAAQAESAVFEWDGEDGYHIPYVFSSLEPFITPLWFIRKHHCLNSANKSPKPTVKIRAKFRKHVFALDLGLGHRIYSLP